MFPGPSLPRPFQNYTKNSRLAVGRSDNHIPTVTKELLSVDQDGGALAAHRDLAVLHNLESADRDVEEAVKGLGLHVL